MNLSQFNRILIQTLLLPVLALTLVAGSLVLQVLNARKTVIAIQGTSDIIAQATLAQKLIIDEETGLRGYQLTGDPQFLTTYHDAEIPLRSAFLKVHEGVRTQGQSVSQIDSIESAEQTWQVSFAKPLMASINAGGSGTQDPSLNLVGKRQIDAIRAQLDSFLNSEARLRTQEVIRWHRQSRHTVEALLALVISAGILISIFTISRLHRVSDAYQGTLDDLRQQAKATFESEERLRTTLVSLGEGVIVCDPEGCVETLNPIAEDLTGWTQAEAHHKPLAEIFHIVNETTRQLIETPVDKVKRLKRVIGLANHTILIRRDHTEIQIDDSGAPIYDRTGALSGIVMVFRDITEKRHTENALRSSEKLAVTGRLAASIAHEMHNPLDSVMSILHIIRDEKDPASLKSYLDLATSELDRMGKVSRAMLGLYRESDAPVIVDVKDMLESVLLLLENKLKIALVQVTAELYDGLEVEGYPAELRQVCTNLIVNAAEAAGSRGEIKVTARRGASAGVDVTGKNYSGVYIVISDNGPGIEPSTFQKVFEPFYTTKGEKGTGLGLWISRGIIDKHGGFIDIQSRTAGDDHGTTLTVFLPRTNIGVPVAA